MCRRRDIRPRYEVHDVNGEGEELPYGMSQKRRDMTSRLRGDQRNLMQNAARRKQG